MTTLKLFPLLALLLALAACGDADDGAMQGAPPTGENATMHDHEMADDDGPAEPQIVDGVQVVEIEAGRMGYVPREIALEAGVPARIVFTRTVESECSSQVTIPAFDVPTTDLPLDEPVAVEFTPTESGDFEFVCGMDMQRGSLMIKS
ncbi:MAG: cupredoxin domain-containing protein [Rhodothermales bacterium]